jgi:hypothetical protein
MADRLPLAELTSEDGWLVIDLAARGIAPT